MEALVSTGNVIKVRLGHGGAASQGNLSQRLQWCTIKANTNKTTKLAKENVNLFDNIRYFPPFKFKLKNVI